MTTAANLQRCANERCRALFRPGGWADYEEPSRNSTTGKLGRLISRMPNNVCPVCRKPFKRLEQNSGDVGGETG